MVHLHLEGAIVRIFSLEDAHTPKPLAGGDNAMAWKIAEHSSEASAYGCAAARAAACYRTSYWYCILLA